MKGYLVANVTAVTDPDRYAAYRAQLPPVVEQFGGQFLIRGGAIHAKEGDLGFARMVVIEFPTLDAALQFYGSTEYAPLIRMREESAEARVAIVEGVG